jgi:hypothetical protein
MDETGPRHGIVSRRIGVVVGVLICHAMAIWALFGGGIVRVESDVAAPIRIIELNKPREPPPPIRLQLAPVQGLTGRELAAHIKVPVPEVIFDLPTEAPVATTSNPSSGASSEGTSIGKVAGSGAGAGSSEGSGGGIRAPPKRDIQIVLTRPLTATGVQLAKGEKILITARGTMNWYTGACNGCMSTPDGRPCVGPGFYATYLPCYSLIGRIGPHGSPFEVGSYKSVLANSSGELFLGVNDNGYPDNTGMWVATLSAANSSSPESPVAHSGSKALEKLLTAANSALQSGNFDASLANAREAQLMAVDKTPFENYAINMLLGVVSVQKRDLAAAAPALESAAASPYASAQKAAEWLRAVAIIEFQLKDYAKAVALGLQALEYNPRDAEIQSLIADSRRHLQQSR